MVAVQRCCVSAGHILHIHVCLQSGLCCIVLVNFLPRHTMAAAAIAAKTLILLGDSWEIMLMTLKLL